MEEWKTVQDIMLRKFSNKLQWGLKVCEPVRIFS